MRLFSFLLFLLLVPGVSAAQTTSVTPVHGWLLGPSTLSGTSSQSCILFNQFSDGSGLRFNIRDEKVETIPLSIVTIFLTRLSAQIIRLFWRRLMHSEWFWTDMPMVVTRWQLHLRQQASFLTSWKETPSLQLQFRRTRKHSILEILPKIWS